MLFRILFFVILTSRLSFGGEGPIRVAVFEGVGVGPSSQKLIASLETSSDIDFQVTRITASDIRDGKLSQVDVLIHPGGSGSKQGRALGEEGRLAVRKHTRAGGGYLGVCGGAYLATNDYDWSLGLIDAKVVDRRHWARGTGMVQLSLSPAGARFFELESRELEIYYGQGPLLGRREWDDPDVPDYESLAIYSGEIARKGAPQGVMAGTSAAVRCAYGSGRVFCFSPHPELTEGLHHLIPKTVEWLAGREEGD